MKIFTKLNLVKTIKNVTFLASIGLFTVLIPSEVQSQTRGIKVNCSTFVKPGLTLKGEGLLGDHTLRIDSVSSSRLIKGALNSDRIDGAIYSYTFNFQVIYNGVLTRFAGYCYQDKSILGLFRNYSVSFTAL